MKLKESPYTTEKSGDFKDISFQISENTEDQGLIFEILRSKMYSNPIGSICREIASNSRDANREIGKVDKQIEVEIIEPNNFFNISDLCICFRDNGPGISPDRMINIYSKYASSTKRNTNTQVGGFGLGAKTPMAYSDSFWVITKVDKIKYTYLCYIDETRKGKITELLQEPTEDENGTEVIIPIKDKDRFTFEQQTVHATYFWDIRPILINFKNYQDNQTNYQDKEILVKKDDFMIIPQRDDYHYISIDGIAYKVDRSVIHESGINLNQHSVVLFFQNGDLNVSSNRENLQYDDDTIKSVKEKYKILNNFLHNDLRKYFMRSTDYLDFSNKMFKLSGLKYCETSFDRYCQSVSEYVGYSNNKEKLKKMFLYKGLKPFKQNIKFKYHKIQRITKTDNTNTTFTNLSGKYTIDKNDKKSRHFLLDIRCFHDNEDYVYYSEKGQKNNINLQILKNESLNNFLLVSPISYTDYCKWVDTNVNPERFGLDQGINVIPFHKLTQEEFSQKILKEKHQISEQIEIEYQSYLDIKADKVIKPKKEIIDVSGILKYFSKSYSYRDPSFISNNVSIRYNINDNQFETPNPFNIETDTIFYYKNRIDFENESEINLKMKLWVEVNNKNRIFCIHERFKSKLNKSWPLFENHYDLLDKEIEQFIDIMYLKSQFGDSSLINVLSKINKFVPENSELKNKIDFIISLYNVKTKFDVFSERFIDIINYKKIKPSDEIIYLCSVFIKLLGENFLLFFKIKEELLEKTNINNHLEIYFNEAYKISEKFDYQQHYNDWLNTKKVEEDLMNKELEQMVEEMDEVED